MAFKIIIEFDDDDVQNFITAYNSSADIPITVADINANLDAVSEALRELMFDRFVELIDDEHDMAYEYFADVFDPIEEYDCDDSSLHDEIPPARLN